MQWLEWVAADKKVQIQHKYNGGEVRIGPRQLPADGYCAESNTVFQLYGCWYHGHHCVYNTDKKTNQIKKGPGNREAADLQADTISVSARLCREPGGDLRVRVDAPEQDQHHETEVCRWVEDC